MQYGVTDNLNIAYLEVLSNLIKTSISKIPLNRSIYQYEIVRKILESQNSRSKGANAVCH